MTEFVKALPKAELHVHIEGTLEPEMVFAQAKRNRVDLPFASIEALRDAYEFTDLQSFLDIYYRAAEVLLTEQDFYDLMTAYLERAVADGVRRAEIFFDPQTHTERGIGFGVFMPGFRQAIADAERNASITADMILCFLRHLEGEAAVSTMRSAEPHLEGVIGVGLDSSEVGYPPELYVEAFDLARALGLRAVAHAGEEGPPSYVTEALDTLGAERIDHGIRSLEDPDLVDRLVREQVPLTVCPLSNVALRVVDTLGNHPLARMLDLGLNVSINSDDPAYFGGYVGANYEGVAAELTLGDDALTRIAANSLRSSFLGEAGKSELLHELEDVAAKID